MLLLVRSQSRDTVAVMATVQARVDAQSFAEVLPLIVLRKMLHVAEHIRTDNATELDVREVLTRHVLKSLEISDIAVSLKALKIAHVDVSWQEAYSSRT